MQMSKDTSMRSADPLRKIVATTARAPAPSCHSIDASVLAGRLQAVSSTNGIAHGRKQPAKSVGRLPPNNLAPDSSRESISLRCESRFRGVFFAACRVL